MGRPLGRERRLASLRGLGPSGRSLAELRLDGRGELLRWAHKSRSEGVLGQLGGADGNLGAAAAGWQAGRVVPDRLVELNGLDKSVECGSRVERDEIGVEVVLGLAVDSTRRGVWARLAPDVSGR